MIDYLKMLRIDPERNREVLRAREAAAARNPLPRVGFWPSLVRLLGAVVPAFGGSVGFMVLVLGLVLLTMWADGDAIDPWELWHLTVLVGGLMVTTGSFPSIQKVMQGVRLSGVALFVAWLVQAALWVAVALASGAAMRGLAGEALGDPAGWGLVAWLLMAYLLLNTLGPWLLTRLWRLPIWLVVVLGLVWGLCFLASLLASLLVLMGDYGWWLWVMLASPIVSLPALLALALRPMDHLPALTEEELSYALGAGPPRGGPHD
ncbi:hypothetical protein SAMN05445756_0884 [Kytococcus aerolatus]|uniref:Uncharacterized protein n=1 Tax=Kytococcus aerolatus TaxID=592308 RepID=A0A212TBV2_9MICO|nr:hypothetical protein [Kytococcus aerolatus]SNC63330.1 hypothetical protein SAMN05445756_0884 [Kytococcus aerolatus]